jgi:hypothetical protein
MTMRRISVLLVAVVMMLTMAMGTALAHKSDNHKVCNVREGKKDVTLTGFTHKEQQRYLDKRKNREDYAGKCDNNGGGGVNIARITTAPFR